jgi:hypothetical protein
VNDIDDVDLIALDQLANDIGPDQRLLAQSVFDLAAFSRTISKACCRLSQLFSEAGRSTRVELIYVGTYGGEVR